MAVPSASLTHALAEFARRLDLPELELSSQGLLALDVQGMGRLHLENSPEREDRDDVLLYLSRPLATYEQYRQGTALAWCHHSHGHPFPLRVGLHGEFLVLLTWLPAQALSGTALENATRFLADAADKIFA